VSKLFRDEALAFRGSLTNGAVIARMPISWKVILAFLLTAAVVMIAFLSTQSISRRESAPGVLSLSNGELKVISRSTGNVDQIYVSDGQFVAQGAKLVGISTDQELTAGGRVDVELLRNLDAETVAVNQRLAAQTAAAPLETQAVRRRLEASRRQLDDLEQSLLSRRLRLQSARASYEESKEFRKREIVPKDYMLQREYDYLAQESAVRDAEAQAAQITGSIAQDEALLLKLPHDHLVASAGLRNDLAIIEGRKASVRGQSGYTIVAKAAGRVTALQAKRGQAVTANSPLLTLIPLESSLQAEVYVPSRAIGFIKPGQRVRLLYDAFPYQRFGAGFGHVAYISTTVLRPDEVSAAIRLDEPVYRVLVKPERNTVQAYGSEFDLRAGMAFTADVILENRTFLQFMLDPILAAGKRLGD